MRETNLFLDININWTASYLLIYGRPAYVPLVLLSTRELDEGISGKVISGIGGSFRRNPHPVIKYAMRVIVGLESDEQNGYAFQASFGELNELKKLDGFFNFILE